MRRPRLGPPGFWSRTDGLAGPAELALTPLGTAIGRVVSWRAARPRATVGVPVLCCGNASVGGTGKTILALDLVDRLLARGLSPHVLTRGHGGRVRVIPHRVDPARDTAETVGDEALLLARRAPTWIDRDRARAGRAAIEAGADVLVLDDGLQSPTVGKDASFLLVDGEAGFGNRRVLPAGPLREHPGRAAARCRAVVLVGEDRFGVTNFLRFRRPILRATLVPDDAAIARLGDGPVLAFAGIGRPEKFFAMLRRSGVALAATRAFPDHHPYGAEDLASLAREAVSCGAILATTEKDAVRLPGAGGLAGGAPVAVPVRFAWADDRLDRLLSAVLSG